MTLTEIFIHESIIGSQFIGRIEKTVKVEKFNAIIPSIEGWAKVYGYNQIIVDTDDEGKANPSMVKNESKIQNNSSVMKSVKMENNSKSPNIKQNFLGK